MDVAHLPTAFSIAENGKHHDATFVVENDRISVIYWAPHGVVRRTASQRQYERPEQTARALLREMIQ